nr:hypothetical protein [Tetragenococcus halophilus]
MALFILKSIDIYLPKHRLTADYVQVNYEMPVNMHETNAYF